MHVQRDMGSQHYLFGIVPRCLSKGIGCSNQCLPLSCELRECLISFLHQLTDTQAEQRIGLTRKAGSTTAHQAYLPINLQKRWMYWNLPYPFGIADIRVEDLIDLDECGLFVETADKKIGKAFVGKRVRQEGNYQKSEKLTLLLGIAGSAAQRSNG